MKSCMEFEGLMGGYLDGELSDSDRVRLEEHLRTCAECRERLEGLKLLIKELSELPEEAPAGLTESIMEAIRSEKKRQSGALLWIRRHALPLTAAAAAALLLVCTGIYRLYAPEGMDSASAMQAAGGTAESAQFDVYGAADAGEAPEAGAADNGALAQSRKAMEGTSSEGENSQQDSAASREGAMLFAMSEPAPLPIPALPDSRTFAFVVVVEDAEVPSFLTGSSYKVEDMTDYQAVSVPAAELPAVREELDAGGLRYTSYESSADSPQIDGGADTGIVVVVPPAQ